MYPILGIDFARQRLEIATRQAERAMLRRDLALSRQQPALKPVEGRVLSSQPGRSTRGVATAEAVPCC